MSWNLKAAQRQYKERNVDWIGRSSFLQSRLHTNLLISGKKTQDVVTSNLPLKITTKEELLTSSQGALLCQVKQPKAFVSSVSFKLNKGRIKNQTLGFLAPVMRLQFQMVSTQVVYTQRESIIVFFILEAWETPVGY